MDQKYDKKKSSILELVKLMKVKNLLPTLSNWQKKFFFKNNINTLIEVLKMRILKY